MLSILPGIVIPDGRVFGGSLFGSRHYNHPDPYQGDAILVLKKKKLVLWVSIMQYIQSVDDLLSHFKSKMF